MSLAFAPSPNAAARAGTAPARILMFDSGLGGLTVFAAVRHAIPEADVLYVGDDAVFPYGRLAEADLVARVMTLMERLIPRHDPDAVVIACNTASVSVLPPLRARWPALPFVGTVPAIKPAATASRSKQISVLATPGTVAREYTRDMIRAFAADCAVTLVGAPRLAALAEAAMRGEPVRDEDIAAEIAPAFVTGEDGRRTDTIVLACTHYPLLMAALDRLAPWPVTFIDPAPAIARRTASVLAERGFAAPCSGEAPCSGAAPRPAAALFTGIDRPAPALRQALETRGFGAIGML